MIMQFILSILSLCAIASLSCWICSSWYSISIMRMKYKNGTLRGGRNAFRRRLRIEIKFDIMAILIASWLFIEATLKAKNMDYVIGSHIFSIDIAKSIQWVLLTVLSVIVMKAGIYACKAYYKLEAKHSEYSRIKAESESFYKECRRSGSTAKSGYKNQGAARS